MRNFKTIEVVKSIFEDSLFNSARLEGETREAYKQRLKENANFLKTYKRFGRERFIKFMEFMKKMGEQETLPQLTQDAE